VRLNLKQLKTFSKCPVAYCFSLKEDSVSTTEQERIISNIIAKAILQVMETSYRADWRRIVGWVDKEVFNNTNVYCKEQYDIAKKNSEHILMALGVWYERVYLQWSTEAFVNVPLGVETSGIFIQGTAPVINLRNPIVCTHIDKNPYCTKKEYQSDIEVRGLAWLVSEHLNCDEVTMQCLSIGNRGKMDINVIKFDTDSLRRTATYIDNMCRIIKKKYFYPSVSHECISCKYYSKCNL
tara:strand:- start:342 stop:1055 length:714 start_codon:yes stop_codon:yes gene_type:complete